MAGQEQQNPSFWDRWDSHLTKRADQGVGSNVNNVGKGANWINGASKVLGAGSKGILGGAGKFFAPFALAAGAQGLLGGPTNADGSPAPTVRGDLAQGNYGTAALRGTGALAATVAGASGTASLLGAGAGALGMGGAAGALTTGAAATALAGAASVAAPIAAAIGLGFRGDSFAKETGLFGKNDDGSHRGVGDVYSGVSGTVSDALGGGLLAQGAGALVGGATAGVGAVAAGALGIASDIGSLGKAAWNAW